MTTKVRDYLDGLLSDAALLEETRERLSAIGMILDPYVADLIARPQNGERWISDVVIKMALEGARLLKDKHKVGTPRAGYWLLSSLGPSSKTDYALGVTYHLPVLRSEPIMVVGFYFVRDI